jgi:hypothetical protein
MAFSLDEEIIRAEHSKQKLSFETAYILAAERIATCSAGGDNIAMQRTAESVGFYPVRRSAGAA